MFLKIFNLAIIFFCLSVYSNDLTASSPNQTAFKAVINAQSENSADMYKTQKVTVCVVFKNTYCGGAAPSESILEQYKTEYPLKNSTILLQSASGKNIKIRTNSKGYFKTKLRPGTYSCFMTDKYDKNLGFEFNSSCEEWLKMSFGQITIVSGQRDGYKILYEYGCNPCGPKRP
jgi:hypothetical protein